MEGKNLKDSAKERAMQSGRDTARAAIKRARTFQQTGQGRKRRYTSCSRTPKRRKKRSKVANSPHNRRKIARKKGRVKRRTLF